MRTHITWDRQASCVYEHFAWHERAPEGLRHEVGSGCATATQTQAFLPLPTPTGTEVAQIAQRSDVTFGANGVSDRIREYGVSQVGKERNGQRPDSTS